MQTFLAFLSQRAPSVWTRYGVVVAVLAGVTLFRMVVPLDTAPFLLYLPIVFLIGVALGKGPGFFCVVVSAVLAAAFFLRSDQSWSELTLKQDVAVVEYMLVAGAMVLVCGALRHLLSDKEAALERLRASESSLRTILDTVPVGILFAEAPSGRIVGRNRRIADIVGASSGAEKAIESYQDWTAFHTDGRKVEALDYPLSRVIRGGQPQASLTVHYQRRDGSLVWLDLSAAPVRDKNGAVTGAVVAVADVDARTNAEATTRRLLDELGREKAEAEAAREAAEAANRAKSAFLANMSHELRTPLSAVIGYTELLEEQAEDFGETVALADLGKIKSNAKHLLGLINDVLDLSKIEANRMELYVEDVMLDPFLRDATATIETLAAVKDNRLCLDLGTDLGVMRTDATKLRQCLFNLLGNACKFTERGRITLRARREGDWLSFAVEDTGIGMSPVQLERLFQRFTQADESTTRRFGGTGLGLALSRAFANLLGGDITVTSTQGVGTSFILRVPATAPDLAGALDEAAAAVDLQPVAGDLVLVIDDEASQRDLLGRFLERQRFSVRTAGDGRTGLALARALKPRVILLDVMMPDMDGWSVLRALKADAETAATPVVMVSFVADLGLGIAMGAADAVPKPIDWARLKTVLAPFRGEGGDILVVDDDADMRQRLRSVLERNGWTLREAGNGVEALDHVRSAVPRLILLDLTMPVMDGFAFLHRLREMPGCAGVPVIVLSARDISAAERGQLADTESVLRKDETSLRDLAAELLRLDLTPAGDRGLA